MGYQFTDELIRCPHKWKRIRNVIAANVSSAFHTSEATQAMGASRSERGDTDESDGDQADSELAKKHKSHAKNSWRIFDRITERMRRRSDDARSERGGEDPPKDNEGAVRRSWPISIAIRSSFRR